MAEVDPNRTAPIGSLLAPEINYSGIQTGVADSHLLSLSWRKPVPSGRIANRALFRQLHLVQERAEARIGTQRDHKLI